MQKKPKNKQTKKKPTTTTKKLKIPNLPRIGTIIPVVEEIILSV